MAPGDYFGQAAPACRIEQAGERPQPFVIEAHQGNPVPATRRLRDAACRKLDSVTGNGGGASDDYIPF